MRTNPSMTRLRFFCLLADVGKPMTINAMVEQFRPAVSFADANQIVKNNLNHVIARPVGRGQFSYELKHAEQYKGAWK